MTGQYTGDGTRNHAITGIGFRPKFLHINRRMTVDASATQLQVKDDYMPANGCVQHSAAETNFYIDMIISLDADGFTVGDYNADLPPNKLGELYTFCCWG